MFLKYYYLIICFVWLSITGCSAPNQLEFDKDFELSSFLSTHVHALPGQRVQFQILTQQGDPVPFGLIRFQWDEGGWMSFQTDPNGVLDMEFEKDILDYKVIVSAESKESKVRVKW